MGTRGLQTAQPAALFVWLRPNGDASTLGHFHLGQRPAGVLCGQSPRAANSVPREVLIG